MANKQTVKILALDDEDSITLFFKIALEINGFVVDAFNDPVAALAYLKDTKEDYDLLIIDIKMPNMNGFQFYENVEAVLTSREKKVPRACFLTALEMAVKEEYESRLSKWKETPLFIRKPISVVALSKLASELTTSMKAPTALKLTATCQMSEPTSCRYCGAVLDDKAVFPFSKVEIFDNREYFCNNPKCSYS
jgi:CheY-like chemotaxis protein